MRSKILIIVIILGIGITLILAKSNNDLICTTFSNQQESGYILKSKIFINSKGDYVKTVKIEGSVESTDKKTLNDFESQLKDQYKFYKNKYSGYSYNTIRKKDKLKVNIKIDYDKFNMEKFIEDNVAIKKYIKDGKLTTEGIKRLYESTGATCK